ncbi:MAG TPA: DUF4139 domain-containing protein [Terriglobia bacterium]|nr:DUF4139 domain-containing protein [Terriglobia bacterium]
MKLNFPFRFVIAFCLLLSPALAEDPQLTIYNQNFAVVRVLIPLNLKPGMNQIKFTDITALLEPDSVILRDPKGARTIQIIEQNYRADPVSEQLLLSLNEGKTLDFLVQHGDKTEIVQGKIIRSGYVPQASPYGNPYYGGQGNPAYIQQIIEVDGKLRFGLPGTPLFPALADDTILKPTLNWLLESDKPGAMTAEFSYVTGGMTWNADYNVIAPEKGDVVDIIGWVTIHNQTGKTFDNAQIKLMAGDVSKIQPQNGPGAVTQWMAMGVAGGMVGASQVSEKPFEEYHLYELHRPTTLHDQETKQVEFVRASGIKAERFYVYDGMKIDENQYRGWNIDSIRQNSEYGTQSNPDVWVMREFVNSEANHLGMPLPAGRLRFYRQDTDGQLEFTGENEIKHTPRDETIRAYTGSAFDIKGERRRTDYRIDTGRRTVDESFEIKLRNHKKEPVEVRVVEHLYRGDTWEITQKSDTFLKKDSQTIEFRVQAAPDVEKTVTYTVHYTW